MYLFTQENKKIHINKSHIFNILKIIFVLSTTSLLGCFQDYPTHSPPIEGSIDISKNSKGDLCFMPIFSSAVVMENPIIFNYIKMEELAILDPNAEISDHVKIQIKPKNPNLEQITYSKLDRQLLIVSIGGLDDKEDHFISFQKEFNYPYTPE